MAKIHGAVYLFIGIFVSLISYFSKNQSLKIFIYIGFILGIIGIIKLFISGLSKNKKQLLKQQPRQIQRQPTHHARQGTHTLYCPHCRNIVRISDNFCNRCGTALRRR